MGKWGHRQRGREAAKQVPHCRYCGTLRRYGAGGTAPPTTLDQLWNSKFGAKQPVRRAREPSTPCFPAPAVAPAAAAQLGSVCVSSARAVSQASGLSPQFLGILQWTLASLTAEVAHIVEARQLGSHVGQLVLGPHAQELARARGGREGSDGERAGHRASSAPWAGEEQQPQEQQA